MDIFIKGLYDEKSFVIMTDLQALNGIKNEALLPHYKQVATRFPEENEEEHYVYNNLNHRLKEFGLSVEEILKMDF